jgi:putative transcriptional regulator
MTKFGRELVQSSREALAIALGEAGPARAFVPPPLDVRGIRRKLKLSQAVFAERFGLSVATLRDWEQGRRQPDQTARSYLMVIAREPEAVARALSAA